MQLNCNYFCGAMPDDATESVAWGCKHRSFACPSYRLDVRLSGTQIYDPGVRDKGSGQSSVLPRTRTRASQAKGKSLTARPLLSLLSEIVDSNKLNSNWDWYEEYALWEYMHPLGTMEALYNTGAMHVVMKLQYNKGCLLFLHSIDKK